MSPSTYQQNLSMGSDPMEADPAEEEMRAIMSPSTYQQNLSMGSDPMEAETPWKPGIWGCTLARRLEEAVFTSGAIVGVESFVKKIVGMEEEAFPAGHKTPPVEFNVGGVVLRSLRNLSILRKKK